MVAPRVPHSSGPVVGRRRLRAVLSLTMMTACTQLQPVPVEVEYLDEPCVYCFQLDALWFEILAGDTKRASATLARIQWEARPDSAHQRLARDLCLLAHGLGCLEQGKPLAAEQAVASMGAPDLTRLRQLLSPACAQARERTCEPDR